MRKNRNIYEKNNNFRCKKEEKKEIRKKKEEELSEVCTKQKNFKKMKNNTWLTLNKDVKNDACNY